MAQEIKVHELGIEIALQIGGETLAWRNLRRSRDGSVQADHTGMLGTIAERPYDG